MKRSGATSEGGAPAGDAPAGAGRPVAADVPWSTAATGHGAPRIQSVGFLLSQLGWATASRFRSVIEPFGVEPREFAILRALAAAEGQSQQAVCQALSIPPSRMVGLVDTLEQRGLVERRANAADRRARAIHLTAAGRTLLDSAARRLVEHERWVCEPLSPDERDQLLSLLWRLADHFELPTETHPDLTTHRPMPWPGRPDGPH